MKRPEFRHGQIESCGKEESHRVQYTNHLTEPTNSSIFTTGIPLDSWKEPSLVFYGRAELKQSDHRPVVGIVDVQVIMMIMIL